MTSLAEFVNAVTGFIFPDNCCLYCGSTGPFQRDHFPIPAEFGGTETVRACLHCHNMKDRVSESIANDYMWSQSDDVLSVTFSAPEVAFITGAASLMPLAAQSLIDDLRDFPPSVRIMVARRLRQQIAGLWTWLPPIPLRRRRP